MLSPKRLRADAAIPYSRKHAGPSGKFRLNRRVARHVFAVFGGDAGAEGRLALRSRRRRGRPLFPKFRHPDQRGSNGMSFSTRPARLRGPIALAAAAGLAALLVAPAAGVAQDQPAPRQQPRRPAAPAAQPAPAPAPRLRSQLRRPRRQRPAVRLSSRPGRRSSRSSPSRRSPIGPRSAARTPRTTARSATRPATSCRTRASR